MRVYRAEIHGRLIELRQGGMGGQKVLVDGRVVSEKPFAGIAGASHFFDITDDAGAERPVEVRLIDTSKLGIGKYQVILSVEGRERCRLAPIDPNAPPLACRNCGYSLASLPIENGEIRCPECGRHTSATAIGLREDDSSSPQ